MPRQGCGMLEAHATPLKDTLHCPVPYAAFPVYSNTLSTISHHITSSHHVIHDIAIVISVIAITIMPCLMYQRASCQLMSRDVIADQAMPYHVMSYVSDNIVSARVTRCHSRSSQTTTTNNNTITTTITSHSRSSHAISCTASRHVDGAAAVC